MIRSYFRCGCINEPVIFSHRVNLKLGHRFHALLKVCAGRDYIVPLMSMSVYDFTCIAQQNATQNSDFANQK